MKQSLSLLAGAIAGVAAAAWFMRRNTSRKDKMPNDAVELVRAHQELGTRCDGYVAREEHWVPDMMLLGLALDVVEHSHAVILLHDSEVSRAAIANARAAFEAAVDLLYLVATPSSYDQLGSLMYVTELVEQENLKDRGEATNAIIGEPAMVPSSTPEEVVELDGAEWEKMRPDGRALLGDALDTVRKRKRHGHWSGLGRKALGHEVEARLGEDPGLGSMFDTTYGLLSIHSHPRSRAAHRARRQEGDVVVFTRDEHAASLAAGVAQMACELAWRGMDRRPE